MKGGAEIELTFLGTGTSHGIPVIACSCEVCASNDPRDKRTRTSIHLRTDEGQIIVDTGPDLRAQCLRERIEKIDAVLYTHSHTDHVAGFDDLRRFCDLSDGDLPVYATADVIDDLSRMFRFAFDGSSRHRGYVRPSPVTVEGPFSVAGMEVVPVDLPHGRFRVTGYVFSRGGRKRVAYFTDCSAAPDGAVAAALGVDLLVVDALRERPHPTHMNFRQATEAAAAVRAGRTLFTHMCHDVSHAAAEAVLPDGVGLAFDGMRVRL